MHRRLLCSLFLVALVFSTFVPPALAAPTGTRLAVPYRTQLDGNPYADADCGPASMAMVIGAYGKDVPTRDLRAIVNNLQKTWGVYSAGSLIESLAAVGEAHGLKAIGLFASKGKLRRWTLDEVRQQLDQGHPVVPQVWYRGLPGREKKAYNGDHYIVITGYDAEYFYYNDPIDNDGPGANRRMSNAQFDRSWRNSDFPYAAMAVGGPPSKPSVDLYVEPPPPPRPQIWVGLRPVVPVGLPAGAPAPVGAQARGGSAQDAVETYSHLAFPY